MAVWLTTGFSKRNTCIYLYTIQEDHMHATRQGYASANGQLQLLMEMVGAPVIAQCSVP